MAIGQVISFTTVRDNLSFVAHNLPSTVNSRINADATDRSRSGDQIRTSYVPAVPNFSAGNPIDDTHIRNYVNTLVGQYAVVRTFRFVAVGCGTQYFRRSVWENLANTSAPVNSSSFGGADNIVILDSHFVNANNTIRTTILNNETTEDASFNYCHCSCHSSCHGSRGRR